MADTKGSALDAATTLANDDLINVIDVSDTTMAASGTNKKISKANLKTTLEVGNATQIQGVAVDSTVGTPSDGDILVYRDAGSDFVLEAKPASSGSPSWGDITGTLASQTDLQAALDDKQDVLTEGAFVDGDKTKLDGIEAAADVTDAANVDAAGAVMNSDYTPSHSLLVQQSGTGSPTALTVANETILGRASGGSSEISDLSAAEARAILNVEDGADVTDATNVAAAGAVMTSLADAKGDIFVASADNTVTRLAVGTNDQVLTADSAEATGLKWATPSAGGGGGGQSTYDVIIASSGGDYTTLDAYFTAGATAGDRIWVQDSHALTTTITDSTANLTIEGVNYASTDIDMATNSASITLSGANVIVRGLTFSTGATTVRMTMSGADHLMERCKLTTSHFPHDTFVSSGGRSIVKDCIFISTSTNTTTNGAFLYIQGDYSKFINNYVESPVSGTVVGRSVIRTGNDYLTISDNTIVATAAYPLVHDGIVLSNGGNNGYTITGNTIVSTSATYRVSAIYFQGAHSTISGNTIYGLVGKGVDLVGGNNTVDGNIIHTSSSTSSTGVQIRAFVDNSIITGNRVAGHAKGIDILASTADKTVITGNNLVGNTTAISDNGTGTVNSGNAT